jgi:DNA-binding MarR family transcriptional regulator
VTKLSPQECAVLRAVDDEGGRSVPMIASQVGLTVPEVRRIVNRFEEAGYLRYRLTGGTRGVDITTEGGAALDRECPSE